MYMSSMVMADHWFDLADFNFFWAPVRTRSPKDMVGIGQSWLV